MTKRKRGGDVQGGRMYGRLTPNGPLLPAPDAVTPDVWICRRVADFPAGRVPVGGAIASCTQCGAAIVFNPARLVSAPKICMQCGDIVPLPIEPTS